MVKKSKNFLLKSIIALTAVVSSLSFFVTKTYAQSSQWAFEEYFEHDPSSPSQDLLPNTFDYSVTHRRDSGGILVDHDYGSFVADHADNCDGPMPVAPGSQNTNNLHDAHTSHLSSSSQPDKSFYICKNHMMSSMGEVSGYSVASFWPRQEFDFSGGGILEFDTNINNDHDRSWWEVLIVPAKNARVAPAMDWFPIDEQYPAKSIALRLDPNTARQIVVMGENDGSNSALVDETSCAWGASWCVDSNDPALQDRRIRRTNRIQIENNQIIWSIQKADGSFDSFSVPVPQGLPISRGLVIFKQHAYTPEKDGNMQRYTTHWDSIKFSGPVIAPYAAYDASGVVKLHENGSADIGAQQTITVNIPETSNDAWLFAQLESPIKGQVLLSVNDNPFFSVFPELSDANTCIAGGWHTVNQNLDSSQLKPGLNKLTWKVGPRPACAQGDWRWDGFAAKNVQVRFSGVGQANDGSGSNGDGTGGISPGPTPTSVPDTTITPSPSPTLAPQAEYKIEYFTDKDLSNLLYTSSTPEINFDWKQKSPNKKLPKDGFSARFTRRVWFENGIYKFTAGGDDGVRLYIDGEQIIDGWRNQSFWNYSTEKYLSTGIKTIVLEYFENKGRAALSFDWQPVMLMSDQMCVAN